MRPLSRKARERIRDILLILEAVSYLAAVAALVMLWVQMRDDSRAERAQHSLAFLTQFNAEPMSTYRRTALLPWLPYREQLRASNNRGGLPRPEIDDLARQIVINYDRDHPDAPVSLAIEEVVGFYDQLKICAEEKVCDERILRSYFHGFAVEFQCNYSAVIADLRETMAPDFGQGLVWFKGDSGCQQPG